MLVFICYYSSDVQLTNDVWCILDLQVYSLVIHIVVCHVRYSYFHVSQFKLQMCIFNTGLRLSNIQEPILHSVYLYSSVPSETVTHRVKH